MKRKLNNKAKYDSDLSNISNEIWFYKGYYFQMIWSQGVITKIYNKDDMKQLLCL